MPFSIPARLENERVILSQLVPSDFATLYKVASDPVIWEQHPNRDRWKLPVFQKFFEGATACKGAYKVVEKSSGDVVGSTRFYDFDGDDDWLSIGYTFYGTTYWGTGLNTSVKVMMLDYAFRYVSSVYFHVGACNRRSQVAVSRLGAEKVSQEEIAYYGESAVLNYVYESKKDDFYSFIKDGLPEYFVR
jgi:RimJ/RimL family protein N-acetyltransferase